MFHLSGSYSPAALNNIETAATTEIVLDLTSVQAAAAESSAKADLGATRAPEYMVTASIEFDTEPVTGETVDFYWAPSSKSGAAVGNPGYVAGASAAFTGTPATLAEALKQLTYIGSLVASADLATTVQTAVIGVLRPTQRYGTLIVHNNTVDHFEGDAIEMAVAFDPIIPQSADAV